MEPYRVFITAGIDDVLNQNANPANDRYGFDYFVGAGVMFLDTDLSNVLPFIPFKVDSFRHLLLFAFLLLPLLGRAVRARKKTALVPVQSANAGNGCMVTGRYQYHVRPRS